MGFYRGGEGARIPEGWAAITPSDSAGLKQGCIELHCEVAGDIVVDMLKATQITIPSAVVSGYNNVLTGRFTKVYASSTTATGISGWFE